MTARKGKATKAKDERFATKENGQRTTKGQDAFRQWSDSRVLDTLAGLGDGPHRFADVRRKAGMNAVAFNQAVQRLVAANRIVSYEDKDPSAGRGTSVWIKVLVDGEAGNPVIARYRCPVLGAMVTVYRPGHAGSPTL